MVVSLGDCVSCLPDFGHAAGVYLTLEMPPNPGPLYGQFCAHSNLVSVRLVWTPFYIW